MTNKEYFKRIEDLLIQAKLEDAIKELLSYAIVTDNTRLKGEIKRIVTAYSDKQKSEGITDNGKDFLKNAISEELEATLKSLGEDKEIPKKIMLSAKEKSNKIYMDLMGTRKILKFEGKFAVFTFLILGLFIIFAYMSQNPKNWGSPPSVDNCQRLDVILGDVETIVDEHTQEIDSIQLLIKSSADIQLKKQINEIQKKIDMLEAVVKPKIITYQKVCKERNPQIEFENIKSQIDENK